MRQNVTIHVSLPVSLSYNTCEMYHDEKNSLNYARHNESNTLAWSPWCLCFVKNAVFLYIDNIYTGNGGGPVNNEYNLLPAWLFIRKPEFPWMHRSSSAHWCRMKPLGKIHSHFLRLSGSRVVRVHDPVIPPLALGAAHPITLLQTAPDSCCSAQFFSISPVCQYELRSCADGPIVAVKMIYYIQRVSYRITCMETAHIACQWNADCAQRLSLQWVQREAGRRTEWAWRSWWGVCIDWSDHCVV